MSWLLSGELSSGDRQTVAQGPEQRQGFVRLVIDETARRKRRSFDGLLQEDVTEGVELNESVVADEMQEVGSHRREEFSTLSPD